MIKTFLIFRFVGKPFAITTYKVPAIRGLNSRFKKMHSVVRKESKMLWAIGLSLFILWLLGFLGGYTGGGIIHILLAVAIIVVPIDILQGQR